MGLALACLLAVAMRMPLTWLIKAPQTGLMGGWVASEYGCTAIPSGGGWLLVGLVQCGGGFAGFFFFGRYNLLIFSNYLTSNNRALM
jgi:hypothetical protein